MRNSEDTTVICSIVVLVHTTREICFDKYYLVMNVCACASTFTRRTQQKVLFTVKRSRTHVYKSYLYRTLCEGKLNIYMYIFEFGYFSVEYFSGFRQAVAKGEKKYRKMRL